MNLDSALKHKKRLKTNVSSFFVARGLLLPILRLPAELTGLPGPPKIKLRK